MGSAVLQRLQSALRRKLFHEFNFKPKQILYLQHLIDGNDVVVVLLTGFGVVVSSCMMGENYQLYFIYHCQLIFK